ncbi:hypothetical protein BJ741DRAFT_101912 [Chytriomyces cf. hyalinus JEL632]|nr:hypothetical protein BJ741DRAFT_101912 [Chytriomyces cf. hyalinus JEL632]
MVILLVFYMTRLTGGICVRHTVRGVAKRKLYHHLRPGHYQAGHLQKTRINYFVEAMQTKGIRTVILKFFFKKDHLLAVIFFFCFEKCNSRE